MSAVSMNAPAGAGPILNNNNNNPMPLQQAKDILYVWGTLDKQDLMEGLDDNQIIRKAEEFNKWFDNNYNNLVNITSLDLHVSYGTHRLTSLPPQIFRLVNLKSLYIYGHSLKEVSDEISNLTKLEKLDLGNNELESISGKIGSLINLTHLSLMHNPMCEKSESFPKEMISLKKLKNFDCSRKYRQPPLVPAWVNQTNFPDLLSIDSMHTGDMCWLTSDRLSWGNWLAANKISLIALIGLPALGLYMADLNWSNARDRYIQELTTDRTFQMLHGALVTLGALLLFKKPNAAN